MKKRAIIFLLGLFLAVVSSTAEVNYNGRIDSYNGVHKVEFKLFSSESSSLTIWSEKHNEIEFLEGNFSVDIGSINPMITIDPATDYYIEIFVDGELASPREEIELGTTEVRFYRDRETTDDSGGVILDEMATSLEIGNQVDAVTVLRGTDFGIGLNSGTDPLSTLDVREGSGRFWDGSATITYATTEGELYVENDLEVDNTIYGSHYRGNAGGDLLHGGTDITVSEEVDGSWTIDYSGSSGASEWTDGGTTLTTGENGESILPFNGGNADVGNASNYWRYVYAQRYYDADNAAYYIDPVSASVINELNVHSTIYNTGAIYGGAVAFADDIVPNSNAAHNLGSSSINWGSLYMNGRIYLANNAGTSGQVLTSNGSGASASWQTPGGDSDWTVSGSNQYSAVSGNVGIGTSSPYTKLEVNGDISVPSGDGYRFITGGTGWEWGIGRNLITSTADGIDIVGYSGNFQIIDVDGTSGSYTYDTYLDIDMSTGVVTIGNTEVEGDLSVDGMYIDSDGDGGSSGQVLTSTVTGTNWAAPASSSEWYDAGSYLRPNESENVYPYTSNTNDLGSSSNYWRYVYASRYYDGNSTSYYLDPASTSYFNTVYGASAYYNVYYDRNNTSYRVDPAGTSVLHTGDIRNRFYNGGGSYGGDVAFYDDIVPSTTGVYSLGTSAYRWNHLWLNGNIYIDGSYGSAGQVLTSNGSSGVYWSTPTSYVSGSGTSGRNARWTGTTTLGNSAMYDNGAQISVGTSIVTDYQIYGYETASGDMAVYGRNAYSTDHWGYLGGSSYGIYGSYDAGRYGYIGSSSYGTYGAYDSQHYGYLGYTSYSIYGYSHDSSSARKGVYGYRDCDYTGDASGDYGVQGGNSNSGQGGSCLSSRAGVGSNSPSGNYGDDYDYLFGVEAEQVSSSPRFSSGVMGAYTSSRFGSLAHTRVGGSSYGLVYNGGSYSGSGFFARERGEGNPLMENLIVNCGAVGNGDLFGHLTMGKEYGQYVAGSRYGQYVSGNIITNSEYAVLTDTDSDEREVSYAVSSPNPMIQAGGFDSISSESKKIHFDETFSATIMDETPIVTISPIGRNADIYIEEIERDGFTVRNESEGTIQFTYIALAKRKTRSNNIPQEVVESDYDDIMKRYVNIEEEGSPEPIAVWIDKRDGKFHHGELDQDFAHRENLRKLISDPYPGNGIWDYFIDLSYKGMKPEDECADCAPVYWSDLIEISAFEPKLLELQREVEKNIQIFSNANSILQSSEAGRIIEENDLANLQNLFEENPENYVISQIIDKIEYNNHSLIHEKASKQQTEESILDK